jgi:hypothetical protein
MKGRQATGMASNFIKREETDIIDCLIYGAGYGKGLH